MVIEVHEWQVLHLDWPLRAESARHIRAGIPG